MRIFTAFISILIIGFFPIIQTSAQTSSISGEVSYHLNQSIEDVNLYLINGSGTVVDSSITDVNGHYSFSNVPNGVFTIVSETDLEAGGITAVDVALVWSNVLFLYPLDSIQMLAADVDANGAVNFDDGLYILLKYLSPTYILPAGEWVFETPIVALSKDNTNTTIGGSSVGDVDGSFEPASKPLPEIVLQLTRSIEAGSSEIVQLPLLLSQKILTTGFGLSVNYPSEYTTILDVTSKVDGLQYNVEGDQIFITWVDKKLTPVEFDINEPVVNIEFLTSETFSDDKEITLSLNHTTGFAGKFGNEIEGINLLSNKITASDRIENGITNYPNPFQTSTQFSYSITQAENVSLQVFNMSGELVVDLIDAFQDAGTYKLSYTPENLSPGVYLYHFSAGNYSYSGRIIYSK